MKSIDVNIPENTPKAGTIKRAQYTKAKARSFSGAVKICIVFQFKSVVVKVVLILMSSDTQPWVAGRVVL